MSVSFKDLPLRSKVRGLSRTPPTEKWQCSLCLEIATKFRNAFERYVEACSELGQLEVVGEVMIIIGLRQSLEARHRESRQEAERIDSEFRARVTEANGK